LVEVESTQLHQIVSTGGEGMAEPLGSEIRVKGEDLLRKVREVIREGNVRRLIIKDEQGKTYLEVPLTLGVVGLVLAPVWAALGALAAMAANFTIEIQKRE
jgi:hypothetical protein